MRLSIFAFYLITARIISGGSSYFGGEVRWGKYPISENLRGLAGAIVKSLTGYNSVHYNCTYGLILMLAAILLLICKREASGIGARTWLYAIATVFSPYLLTLVSGGYSPIRAKLAFPLCVAFWTYMCMFLCRQVNVRFNGFMRTDDDLRIYAASRSDGRTDYYDFDASAYSQYPRGTSPCILQ